MSVFAVLFWLWFAVSTTIFIQRRIKARATKRAMGPMSADRSSTVSGSPAPGAPTPPWVTDARQPGASAPSPAMPAPAAPAPAAPTTQPDNGAHRVSARETAHPATSIAEALQGIAMPCDLAPLTLGMHDLDPGHVELVTCGVEPETVATALTAELERLGYGVSDLGAGEHLADREGTVVRVKVHDRPRLSVSSDGRGFATAPADGIVVEMTVV